MVSPGGTRLRSPETLERMETALRHRGPDGRGTVVQPNIALGATRLRIVDPSPAADQPFCGFGSTLVLVCNGEIYNADEIRRRYPRYPFRSRSDVETLLPLYADRGVQGLSDVEGMFALALYDRTRRQLVLARDRAGEKPLFYTRVAGEIWFASELHALLQPRGPSRSLDDAAVGDLLTLGYVCEPRTMFTDVRKVEAGTALLVTPDHTTRIDYCPPAAAGLQNGTPDLDELGRLLKHAVTKQTTPDTSVGIFASGGVDSALLATHAVDHMGPDRVHLFTVGFADRTFDETKPASQLAKHLGTKHTVVQTDDRLLAAALDMVVNRVAEPITDPAVLPTLLLAQAASEHLKVVMSGEGADELFGGYPTYLGHRTAARYVCLPRFIRRAVARTVNKVPASHHKVSVEFLLKNFLRHVDADTGERHVAWFGTGIPGTAMADHITAALETPAFPNGDDPVASASQFDYQTYLRDNLLTKVDRATMLYSLEARAPFLDPKVVKFAQGLDSQYKVRGFTTKWALKQIAARSVPRAFVHRTKRGLSVPVARWLNTTLRGEVDRLLSSKRVAQRGLLQPEFVCQLLSEHRSGRVNHARPLWALLILEYWLERWAPEGDS